jgi:hypothetical protein
MDAVKNVEAFGTSSGHPTSRIVIADCGQLPSGNPAATGSATPAAPAHSSPFDPVRNFFAKLFGGKQSS